MKTTKGKTKRNDLTLEIKERIKEYLYQELSPEQIVGVCSKNGLSCPQSLFINIFGKIKGKGEFVFKSTNNWKRYRKKRK
jgi:IS30 family transposase